jgi:hypothetical protein
VLLRTGKAGPLLKPAQYLRGRLEDGRLLGYAIYGDPAGQPVFYFHGLSK